MVLLTCKKCGEKISIEEWEINSGRCPCCDSPIERNGKEKLS
jgi:Zn finger protein HypA/HybF involved in hydrogenase expression